MIGRAFNKIKQKERKFKGGRKTLNYSNGKTKFFQMYGPFEVDPVFGIICHESQQPQ